MVKDIQAEDLYQLKKTNKQVIVDVRSPQEFQEATIPGSINIPLFSDQERAEVGTIYKQQGPEAAKEKGLA
ncbi:rhodanese-like domain-containing protein, partial [Gracilibacillus boraciitolerans]|uniref:rhodanese-like domain-containing protein n=1 Tax=Gracilibacillus boraciitolerans TaxID=307521 RepID=UPI00054CDEF8